MINNYIIIFIISMLPLIELRGAIPYSQAVNLPLLNSYIVAIIGNMIPVPFIYFFARKILKWGSTKIIIKKPFTWCLNKGKQAGEKLEKETGKGIFVALMLFVGIPLPGTGAWTGTLAASILDIDAKLSIIAVLLGVIISGIIMLTISFGIFNIF